MSTLYLLPSPLADGPLDRVLAPYNLGVMRQLTYFVVEEVRTARRFLSKAGMEVTNLQLATLNEHTPPLEIEALIQPMLQGFDMGLISEAGLPAVADPGAALVALAHKRGFQVVPLVGPSSLMLALMASGLNGQQFAFNGYLPVKPDQRHRHIVRLEKRSAEEHATQLFIETPYRNAALFDSLIQGCRPTTFLTVAANLTAPNEYICTRTIAQWRLQPPPFEGDLHKVPCVFLLLAL